MNKLIATAAASALSLTIAACAAPAEEEDGIDAEEVATVNTATDDSIGNAGEAPDMETVRMAIDEACPGFGTNLRSSMCQAANLGQSFTCEFALESDPANTTRELSISQDDAAWTVAEEPEFCSSLERANAMADEPAQTSVDTQPE